MKLLRKILDKDLTRRYIRVLTSLTGHLVLFVLKKDVEVDLRIYIDYRPLNNETIKNRYLLPLISEL